MSFKEVLLAERLRGKKAVGGKKPALRERERARERDTLKTHAEITYTGERKARDFKVSGTSRTDLKR